MAGGATGFYPFIYEWNGTCVAHAVPANRSKTLQEICQSKDIAHCSADASALHQKFIDAASSGGAWVRYDWTNNRDVQPLSKLSYVFSVYKFKRRFYVGVGTNLVMAPEDCDERDSHFSNASTLFTHPKNCVAKSMLRYAGHALAMLFASDDPTDTSSWLHAVGEGLDPSGRVSLAAGPFPSFTD